MCLKTTIAYFLLCCTMSCSLGYCSVTNQSTEITFDQSNDTIIIRKNTSSRTVDSYCPSWCGPLKCTDEVPMLRFGHCLTFEKGKGISAVRCPYFQLTERNITEFGYILLPPNISKLNHYICGSMNRQGYLCKDCIDGFGPSVTSIGYTCSNCSTVWYGVPLYLLVEFLPITVLYIVIYILPIRLTSAPMTCFILYSQLIVVELVMERKLPIDIISPNHPLLKTSLVLYSLWNMDILRYILPPFCVSRHLQIIHIVLLNYLSILYPIFLIFVTWVLIEIHGRNFKPLVWCCTPFHKLLIQLRKATNVKYDIIDVFATFMLLSYSKMLYQSYAFIKCTTISNCSNKFKTTKEHVMIMDVNIKCGSVEHILSLTSVIIPGLILNIIPTLVLVLYPMRIFRKCLTKCKLNGLVLITFVERFHGCYRDGLDGKRDMRSFSGFYFLLRYTPAFASLIKEATDKLAHMHTWIIRGLIFSFAALLIAFSKPYKLCYMNVLDTLLLTHLSLICHLLARNWFPGSETQILLVVLIPALILVLLIVFKLCCRIRNSITVKQCPVQLFWRRQSEFTPEGDMSHENELISSLNQPTSSTIPSFKSYYGSIQ